MNKANHRDSNIELIRVIACIIVIALHTWKGSGIDEVSVSVKGVIRVFEHFGVPCFLMIMGFFLFNGKKTYGKRIRDVAWRVFIPFIIAYVWYELAQDWLLGERTFEDCFTTPKITIKAILFDILSGSVKCNSSFWYIFEYIKIIIFAPLLGLMCKEGDTYAKIRRGYAMLCLAFSIVSNLLAIYGNMGGESISPVNVSPLSIYALYVVIGYEISILPQSTVKRIKEKKWWILLTFVMFNFVICFEEFVNIKLGGENKAFFSENSILQVASSVAIFLFLRTLDDKENKNRNIVNWVGRCTYLIYLIHWTFTKIVASYGLPQFMQSIPSLMRYLLTVLLIFVMCLIIASVIKLAGNGVACAIKSHKYGKEQ